MMCQFKTTSHKQLNDVPIENTQKQTTKCQFKTPSHKQLNNVPIENTWTHTT